MRRGHEAARCGFLRQGDKFKGGRGFEVGGALFLSHFE